MFNTYILYQTIVFLPNLEMNLVQKIKAIKTP